MKVYITPTADHRTQRLEICEQFMNGVADLDKTRFASSPGEFPIQHMIDDIPEGVESYVVTTSVNTRLRLIKHLEKEGILYVDVVSPGQVGEADWRAEL